jgi:hypothetical protein
MRILLGRRLLPALLAALLLPAGCAPDRPLPLPPTALPTAAAAVPAAPSALPTAAATRTRVPRPTLVRTATAAPSVAPAALTDGLAALDSYRIAFTAVITDSSGGLRRTTLELSVAADGSRRAVTVDSAGAVLTLFEQNGRSYRLAADECLAVSAVEAAALLPDPALIVAGFNDARQLETTTTPDGRAAQRLDVSTPLLPAAPAADLSGSATALRAIDGGYLLAFSGTFTNPPAGVSWDYRLDRINAVEPISLPAACSSAAAVPSATVTAVSAGSPTTRTAVPPAAVSSALLPTDAANLTRLGTLTLLTSRQSVAALSAGYLQTLTNQGWRAAAPREQAGSTILNFSRDGRRITVTLAREDDLTTVMISQP